MKSAALSPARLVAGTLEATRRAACRVPASPGQSRDTPVLLRSAANVSLPSTPLLAETSSASAPDVAQAHTFPLELACPICLDTKFSVGRTGHRLSAGHRQQQALYCERCERTFSASKGSSQYVDLTPLSGFEGKVYKQTNWGGMTLFETPIMSYIYERGYRQNFQWFGFPGVQKEFEMAMDYLQPAYGEVLVDMSCGSGLFTRCFAASGRFKGVIAADYSVGMLDQTSGFIAQNATVDAETVLLLRADITRLPFATSSLAAIHAGAAIHCWPNPTIAMSEIARVLRPGGVFVGTTVMKVGAGLGEVFGDDIVRPLSNLDPLGSVSYRPWEEAELRELGSAMGMTNFRRYRTRRFIMFCMERPGGGSQDHES